MMSGIYVLGRQHQNRMLVKQASITDNCDVGVQFIIINARNLEVHLDVELCNFFIESFSDSDTT
jgi:hypothetical protein